MTNYSCKLQGPMLIHFKKSNEILETWSPHCKNLAFQGPPSLKFHNRTDINIQAIFRPRRQIHKCRSTSAAGSSIWINTMESISFSSGLIIFLKFVTYFKMSIIVKSTDLRLIASLQQDLSHYLMSEIAGGSNLVAGAGIHNLLSFREFQLIDINN